MELKREGRTMCMAAKWNEMRKIIAARIIIYSPSFFLPLSFWLFATQYMSLRFMFVRGRERDCVQPTQSNMNSVRTALQLKNKRSELNYEIQQWHEAKIVHRFERLIKSHIAHITYFLVLMVVAGQFWLFPYFPFYFVLGVWVYWCALCARDFLCFLSLGLAKRKVLAAVSISVTSSCKNDRKRLRLHWNTNWTIKPLALHTQTHIKHKICIWALVFLLFSLSRCRVFVDVLHWIRYLYILVCFNIFIHHYFRPHRKTNIQENINKRPTAAAAVVALSEHGQT